METAIMKDGHAIEAGYIIVYNYNQLTGEFIGQSDEYIPVGVGLPAYSCTDAPPEPRSGFAICRNLVDETWEFQPDHRGEKVWSTADCSTTTIDYIGSVRDGYTDIAPLTPFDKWIDKEWVTDKAAQHVADVGTAEQQKDSLLAGAQRKIGLWQTELQLGVISDEDKESLIAWVQYIKVVQAVDTSKAPDIIWPVAPQI
jgi:hypothetical protein